MGDIITIAQLEDLLGVKITIDFHEHSFSGIHLGPDQSTEINVRLILTGVPRN